MNTAITLLHVVNCGTTACCQLWDEVLSDIEDRPLLAQLFCQIMSVSQRLRIPSMRSLCEVRAGHLLHYQLMIRPPLRSSLRTLPPPPAPPPPSSLMCKLYYDQ